MSFHASGRKPNADQEKREIIRAALGLLHGRTPAILAANLVNSLLVAAVVYDGLSHSVAIVWLALIWLSVLVRGVLWFHLRDREQEDWVRRWGRASQVGSYTSGVLWGAAGILFFEPTSPIHLAVLSFVLGGMAAGSLTTLSAHLPSFNGYLLLSLLPFLVRLVVEMEPDHLAMAGMVLMYIVSLLVIGKRTHATLTQNFSLAFENVDLIRSLEKRVTDRTRRHATVVEFSHRALSGMDADALLREAASIVADGLPATYAVLSEWLPDRRNFRVRAAAGRQEASLRQATLPGSFGSPAGYTLMKGKPTISADLRVEDRFRIPPFLQELGVVSTISVPIWGHVSPFGALEAWNADSRPTADDDVNFLRAVAATIAAAMERQRTDDGLQRIALHDPLTGLPNRSLFSDHLSQVISLARRTGEYLALLLIDLDHFKDVNDTLGHAAGDQLLVCLAQRLRQCTRRSDPPARLGGDEFAVVLTGLNTPEGAAVAAEKIVSMLGEPVRLAGHDVHIGASIGITIYPLDGENPDLLLRNADLALYKAKAQGRRAYAYYSHEMALDVENRINLLQNLRGAIDAEELNLEYQPQVTLATGKITGVEALLRWNNPRIGIVLPETFIPVAEASGLISSLGDWAMRRACTHAREWSAGGLPDITTAVNVSLAQWRRGNVTESIRRVLRTCEMQPHRLELEITERAFPVNDEYRLLECLSILREEGISISIDDFGTGYSNLARLRQLPVDRIKIDSSFIAGLGQDVNSDIIVRAIIALGQNLGVKVVAEGVERQSQLDFLRDAGCDVVQGYFVGWPMKSEDFMAFFRKGQGRVAQISVPGRQGRQREEHERVP